MVSINALHVFLVFFFVIFLGVFDVCFSEFNSVNSSLVNVTRPNIRLAGNGFGSMILPLKGNVYPDGHYLVSLNIGNPPKPFDLDVDTGSTITWVQCDAPCVHCTLPKDRQYKPHSNVVPCGNPLCTGLSPESKMPCRSPNDQCDYHVEYADDGKSTGVLVHDIFSISIARQTVTPDIAFGCGYDQFSPSPNSLPPPGVLGLGNNKVGILAQMNTLGMTRNIFAHCLGRQDGALIIGDAVLQNTRSVSWVPLGNSELYSSGPAEIYHLGRPTGTTLPRVFFDAGSTYTYLNQQAYQAVFNMIKNDLVGKPLEIAPEDRTLLVCWKGKGGKGFKSVDEAKLFFKPLALTFTQARNVQLDIPPESYLIVSRVGNICLGILPGTPSLGNQNIIGDISMQNKLVIYDNERRVIGWAAATCKTPRTT